MPLVPVAVARSIKNVVAKMVAILFLNFPKNELSFPLKG